LLKWQGLKNITGGKLEFVKVAGGKSAFNHKIIVYSYKASTKQSSNYTTANKLELESSNNTIPHQLILHDR